MRRTRRNLHLGEMNFGELKTMVDRHLGCIHVLGIVNSVVMNIGILLSF